MVVIHNHNHLQLAFVDKITHAHYNYQPMLLGTVVFMQSHQFGSERNKKVKVYIRIPQNNHFFKHTAVWCWCMPNNRGQVYRYFYCQQ